MEKSTNKTKPGEVTIEELEEKYANALRRLNMRKAAMYKAKLGIKKTFKELDKLNKTIEEEKDEDLVKELKESRMSLFGLISEHHETLNEVKRNKLGSESYEFERSFGNRRQRRMGETPGFQR